MCTIPTPSYALATYTFRGSNRGGSLRIKRDLEDFNIPKSARHIFAVIRATHAKRGFIFHGILVYIFASRLEYVVHINFPCRTVE